MSEPQRHVPRCRATSKGTGRRCGRAAIPGGSVCRYHGGAAPQVQRSARRRLEALAEPAVGALSVALESEDLRAAVRAAVAVLDRTGHGPRDRGVTFPLPRVTEPAHVVAALAELLDQVARGSLSPVVAGDIAALLREQRDALTLSIIDERLRRLEEPKC